MASGSAGVVAGWPVLVTAYVSRTVLGVHLRVLPVAGTASGWEGWGQLVTGLVIVQGVFRVPGIGGLLFAAIADRDRSRVVGIVTFVAVLVIVANALADVAVPRWTRGCARPQRDAAQDDASCQRRTRRVVPGEPRTRRTGHSCQDPRRQCAGGPQEDVQ